ncbi:hypothetical protein OTU49_004850, partial [Cherax quadricarinatus]
MGATFHGRADTMTSVRQDNTGGRRSILHSQPTPSHTPSISAHHTITGNITVNDGQTGRREWTLDGVSARRRHSALPNPHSYRSVGSSLALSLGSVRTVEAFTPASRMRGTMVGRPPKLGVFRPRPAPPTTFRKMYERGDVPVTLHHDHHGHNLRW